MTNQYDIRDLDYLMNRYPNIGRGLQAAKEEIEQLRGLLKAAKCPNGGCDGEGHIAHDTGEMIDWEPCQWCHEREEATRSPVEPTPATTNAPDALQYPTTFAEQNISGDVHIRPEDIASYAYPEGERQRYTFAGWGKAIYLGIAILRPAPTLATPKG